MLDKDLISIVVPIYNVENYLNKCINSILKQTYKNIEIILVDDGSTDSSGYLCDQISKTDNRIIVIHKNNGGLSSARNTGIDNCNGKYIIFIDSDDYISENMVKFLYEDIINTQSDMSICGYYEVYKNDVKEALHSNERFTISSEEALSYLYSNYCVITSLAWNKIFKRNLFEKVRFTEGKVHEDDIIILDILKNINKISFNLKPLYYYVQRNNSITGKFSSKRLDCLYALENREHYFERIKRKDLIDLNTFKKYYIVTEFIKSCKKNKENKYEELIKECEIKKKKYFNLIKKSKYISLKRKIYMFISYYFCKIYYFIK